jgi:hypothetical protein
MSQGRMENRLCQDVPGAPDRLNERLGSLWDVRFIEGRPKTRACCARCSTSTTRCCNAVWVSACVARSRAMAAPASASRARNAVTSSTRFAITACASSCRRYPPDDPHATDGAV